ncbi:MAG TPA: hypothetical protein VE981_05150 [Planctomycetota bacterium]|nr:hypothetical protein [Planctomycetota bacterium]
MKRAWMLLLLAVPLASCATRKSMMAKPLDSGVKGEFEAPFDKVKRAAYDSLADMAFSVKDEKWDARDSSSWVINSSQGLSTGSTGRYARVTIEKTDTRQTVYVLVESKAAVRDSMTVDEAIGKDLLSRIEKRSLGK